MFNVLRRAVRTGAPRAFRKAMETSTKLLGRRCSGRMAFTVCPAIFVLASLLGCNGAVATGPSQPPPITVSVSPASASVLLGESLTFTATVSNTTNTSVTWTVNGIVGGNSVVGTISSSGAYTAPGILPSPVTVNITATSVADPAAGSTAALKIASDVSVSISPQNVSVELGSLKQFSATLNSAGLPQPGMTWSVSGSGCAANACGVVDGFGNYTAPQNLPSPPNVTLTATSMADPSKSAAAAITIASSFTMSLAGPATAGSGTVVTYTVTINSVANSNPNRSVVWSVSGPGCSGAACGAITSAGVYTAPAQPPTQSAVQITATSVADATKFASLSVSIFATLIVTITPASATLAPGAAQGFQAQVSGAADTTVTWDVNGVVGGNSTVGTIRNSQTNPDSTTYTAPAQAPSGSITVRATSNANPNIAAYAIIQFAAGITVTLSPTSATRVTLHRQNFIAQVNATPNQAILWSVAGIPGGNSSVGQICVAGSSPCSPTSLDSSGSVDYLAPAMIPFPNPVTITAASQANSSATSSASVTILPHLVLSVLPATATVVNGGKTQFSASLLGSDNQQVTWTVSGAGCGAAGACGTIDSTGLYTAPAVAPAPNLIAVTATSAEDTTQSATANVTITSGPNISTLAPSSAYLGSSGVLNFAVSGNNFAVSTPGPGSTILVAGSPRATSCPSSTECVASLTATDLAVAGNLSISVQNPGGSTSNSVSFVVLPPGSGSAGIPLTPGAPAVTGEDISVVDLSTNGSSGAPSLNIAAIGAYSSWSNSCVLADSAVVLLRPASGITSGDICVFSLSGLDPSYTYTISGPSPADITILGGESLGLGILHLKFQIPATALPGPRTLFVENPNKDKAAGTGSLEVR